MENAAKGRQSGRWRLIWVLQMLLVLLSACHQKAAIPAGFVRIPDGEFMMGSSEKRAFGTVGWPENIFDDAESRAFSHKSGFDYSEKQHEVLLSEFYISKYEVTVGEFKEFVDATGYKTDAEREGDEKTWQQPGISQQSNHPVVYVSWNDAVAYCKWLSEKTGQTYRLPTEAEWEYACRAGTGTPFNTGTNLTTEQANYDGNYPYYYGEYGGFPLSKKVVPLFKKVLNGAGKEVFRKTTVPVDSFAPNAWGFYNMHGNVAEWCSDWYEAKYYDECNAKGVVRDPAGPFNFKRPIWNIFFKLPDWNSFHEFVILGPSRVIRGGGWNDGAGDCRSAYRRSYAPDRRNDDVGFRLVFVP